MIKKKFLTFERSVILLLLAIILFFGCRHIHKYYAKHHGYKYYIQYLHFKSDLQKASKIPISYWDDKYKDIKIKNKYKIVFVTNSGGPHNQIEYLRYVAKNKGWQTQIYFNKLTGYEEKILAFDPDFILFTEGTEHSYHEDIISHRSRKYYWLQNLHLQSFPNFCTICDDPLFKSAHAILSTDQEIDMFRQCSEGKLFHGIQFPTSAPALINKPAEPRSIMYGGFSGHNKQLVTMLSTNNIPMEIYGPYRKHTSLFKTKTYKGYLPAGTIIEAIRSSGIYLLSHRRTAFVRDLPPISARQFEALAANVIIISNRHPFVIKHFGNNILYFDHTANIDTQYKQIKNHFDWIIANPQKAKAMAARAHQIFLNKFTSEKNLIKLVKMHEYILAEEKAMGLKYPLVY